MYIAPYPVSAMFPHAFVDHTALYHERTDTAGAREDVQFTQGRLDPRYRLEGVQQDKLRGSDGSTWQFFGYWMATDGDTMVVGARGNHPAYVFARDGSDPEQWNEVAKLSIGDSLLEDYAIESIAIDGDTVVVGVIGRIPYSTTYQGAAYVYTRNKGGPNHWGQVARLVAFSGIEEFFGVSVAVSDTTIVVGALGDTIKGLRSGAIYVFERDSGDEGQWRGVARLLASDGTSWDDFGSAVAINRDTIVVGSQRYTTYTNRPGAAYIFQRDTHDPTSWNEVTKFAPIEGTDGDSFGNAVALDGDRLVIGAELAGAAYIYERTPGDAASWRQTRRLVASDAPGAGYFGHSVALAGERVMVSAYKLTIDGKSDGGAVYIYEHSSGSAEQWDEITKLTAQPSHADMFFGSAVAFNGNTLISGAHGDNAFSGSVLTHRLYPRPRAGDDTAATDEDLPVVIDVLANDSTPAETGVLAPSSVRVVDTPDRGTTSVEPSNGAITYTPQSDFYGSDSFSYAVSNTIGTSHSATVTVTVRSVNDTPLFSSVPPTTATAYSPYHYRVVTNDVDTGDSLTIAALAIPNWLTLAATGASSATLSGTPADGDVGEQVVSLLVTDAGGLSATQTFTIGVAPNTPPRFLTAPPTRAREDRLYRHQVVATDPDTGQPLTITAPVLPAWLHLEKSVQGTTILTGTPDYAAVGDHAIQLRVEDPGRLGDTRTFTITVEPNRPVAPDNLLVVPIAPSSLRLSWRDMSGDERGFTIERHSGDGSWETVATVGPDSSTWDDQGLECGLVYTYRISAYNKHWSSHPSPTASAAPAELAARSFTSDGSPLAISAQQSITASIVIDDPGLIADLAVQVRLDHIYDGHLLLTLTAPDGTVVVLSAGNGGPGHDYHDTIFDDEATVSIRDGYAPFTGRYQPDNPLSVLLGKPLAGTWTLKVQNYGRFEGVLKGFSLDNRLTVGCPGTSPTATAMPAPSSTTTATPTPRIAATPTNTATASATPAPPLPMVVNINSSPDTGDGQVSEGEVARVSFDRLWVTFNEAVVTFESRSFLLLGEGNQPGFQTTSCARPSPSDRLFFNNFLTFQYPIKTIGLGFLTPAGSLLPEGSYRFIVCDTVTGQYPLLDGDGDGIAGGDLVRTFSIARTAATATLTSTPPTTTTSPLPSVTSTTTNPVPSATSTATRPLPSTTSTATSPLPSATSPVFTPTSTATRTPSAAPQLSIDYPIGRPGSSFTIVGQLFPSNVHLSVVVNGVEIGSATTDSEGSLRLLLSTSAEALPGHYEVMVLADTRTSNVVPYKGSARLEYTLALDSLLRTPMPDDAVVVLMVPPAIQPASTTRVYLPVIAVDSPHAR